MRAFLFLPLLTCVLAFKDCNASQLDFLSHYSLGQQDELNRTFALLNTLLPTLPTLNYTTPDQLFHYSITKAQPLFVYLDSKQSAEIVSDDTLYIRGGNAPTALAFSFSTNTLTGNATALCPSDPISFAKTVYTEQGFLRFKLVDYIPPSYRLNNCSLTRVQPPLSQMDLDRFEAMLNTDSVNMRILLENSLAELYGKALNDSLHDERQPIANNRSYSWSSPSSGKTLTIAYTTLPIGSRLQKSGLTLLFVTEITDDDGWQCGAAVPTSAKAPAQFGGIQEFLSLSILENSVRYAAERGVMDTTLDQEHWQSGMFQFYAGDLYEVIPALTRLPASTPLSGNCAASTENLKLTPSADNRFLLALHYRCELYANRTLISQFDIDPNFLIDVELQQNWVDFRVHKVNKFVHFKDVPNYEIHDIELATLLLTRSLEQMQNQLVFGSNWKTYPRDQPAHLIENGVLLIYDRAPHPEQQ